MTDQTPAAGKPAQAAEPLALRLNDQLGPLPTSAEDEAVVLARLSKTPAEAYELGYMDGHAKGVADERARCLLAVLSHPMCDDGKYGWLVLQCAASVRRGPNVEVTG